MNDDRKQQYRHPSYGTLTPEEFQKMKDSPESYYGNKQMEDYKRLAEDRKKRKKKIRPVQEYMFDKKTDGKIGK